MNAIDSQVVQVRSTFVTALAWIFIAISGLATFIALLQNIIINTVFPFEQISSTLTQDPNTPPMAIFVFEHVRLLFFAFLAVSAATLVVAIGLLRRRNWARLTFIAFLALSIAWNVAGLFVQHAIMGSMPPMPKAPPEFAEDFQAMASHIFVVGVVMSVGFSVLYGWLILRLVSPRIRAEFVS